MKAFYKIFLGLFLLGSFEVCNASLTPSFLGMTLGKTKISDFDGKFQLQKSSISNERDCASYYKIYSSDIGAKNKLESLGDITLQFDNQTKSLFKISIIFNSSLEYNEIIYSSLVRDLLFNKIQENEHRVENSYFIISEYKDTQGNSVVLSNDLTHGGVTMIYTIMNYNHRCHAAENNQKYLASDEISKEYGNFRLFGF